LLVFLCSLNQVAAMFELKVRKEAQKEILAKFFQNQQLYKNIEPLKPEGMGNVCTYTAESTKDNSRVFLKITNMPQKEIKIMKALSHPNIVRYRHDQKVEYKVHIPSLDKYRTKTYHLTEMELATGGSMKDKSPEVGVLFKEDIDEWREMWKNVIDALFHMHLKEYIHNDMKPDNIVFKTPDVDRNISIIDFDKTTNFATERIWLNTAIAYTAPEKLPENKKPPRGCDPHKSDIMFSQATGEELLANEIQQMRQQLQQDETMYYEEGDKTHLYTMAILNAKGNAFQRLHKRIDDRVEEASLCDFIKRLVCGHEKRLTAAQALNHPFMTEIAGLAGAEPEDDDAQDPPLPEVPEREPTPDFS